MSYQNPSTRKRCFKELFQSSCWCSTLPAQGRETEGCAVPPAQQRGRGTPWLMPQSSPTTNTSSDTEFALSLALCSTGSLGHHPRWAQPHLLWVCWAANPSVAPSSHSCGQSIAHRNIDVWVLCGNQTLVQKSNPLQHKAIIDHVHNFPAIVGTVWVKHTQSHRRAHLTC